MGEGARRARSSSSTIVVTEHVTDPNVPIGGQAHPLQRLSDQASDQTVTAQANEPLLDANGLHKRFNALVVLDGVDFTVARRRSGRHRRAERRGQDDAAQRAGRRPCADRRQRALPRRGRHRGCRQPSAAGSASCAPIRFPRPFSGMTVFENVFVAAAHGGELGRDEAYARVASSRSTLCGMTRVANRRAETLGLLDRKRLELARALATGPSVLLLDEIGGGLTDARGERTRRHHPRTASAAASPSSGSSISCISCCGSPSG